MKRFIIIMVVLLIGLIIGNLMSMSFSEKEAEPVSISEPVTSSDVMTTTESVPEYTFYDVPLDVETQKAIKDICTEYDLEYELILGIISAESDFRTKIVGDGGNSFGLMQIQPKWWSEIMEREGVTNLLDPLQNVRCGCAIINELKDKYGTEYRALQAYNTGRPNTNNGYADKVYRRIGELKILNE